MEAGDKSAGDSGVSHGRGHTPLLFKVSFHTKMPQPILWDLTNKCTPPHNMKILEQSEEDFK